MIAFGCVVSEPEAYRRYAEPGIALAREPDSRVYPFAAVGTLGRSCNLLRESAAACEDLEALVILHPHAQLDDSSFTAKVRAALADPTVAVLGVAGGRGEGLAWWRHGVSRGTVVQRHNDAGGGELDAFEWARPGPAPADVDAVDGFVLVLSAWAVRHVAFDERTILGHAFDVDYCRRVRAEGRRVATIDARVIEHRELELVEDLELWVEAHIALADTWTPDTEAQIDWQRRARRAEAEREAARTIAYSRRLGHDMQLDRLRAQLDAMTATRSWRLTRPLRELNRLRRRDPAG